MQIPSKFFVAIDATRCQLQEKGATYTGSLQEDGTIRWSDGDQWKREAQVAAEKAEKEALEAAREKEEKEKAEKEEKKRLEEEIPAAAENLTIQKELEAAQK